MEKIFIVYITASSKKEAYQLGKKILAQKLAACVNIIDNMTSLYRWEGKEESAKEFSILIKTKESLLKELEQFIKKEHSYTCPCILAIPVKSCNDEYAEWINKETK